MADLPPGGRWVPYVTAGVVPSVRSVGQPPPLVRPEVRPCRRGTTDYPPLNRRFNCLGYYQDNANRGHPVLLRLGAAGDFGYLHGLLDHGLDEESIATVVVNNAAGRTQTNDRFLYGLRYEVGGVGLVAVEVYEQRTPDDAFRDGDGLGVVTAFCVGLDRCPDGINESLP